MNVAYIIGQNAGGLPHYTAELANAMTNHGEVTVLKPTETTADGFFNNSVTTLDILKPINISMPSLYSLDIDPLGITSGVFSYNNLRKLVEVSPDVVHDTTGMFPHVRLFLKRHRLDEAFPVISTRHEVAINRFPLSRPAVLTEQLMNFVVPAVDEARTIVHTKKQKHVLLERGWRREEIEVIPHGAYSMFGTYEDLTTEPMENCLLFFGNIVPPKGLDVIVRAMPIVKETVPDVTLVIAGKGTIPRKLQPILERHSECFEIHNRFVPNEQVKELFGRAELVVMPYRFQGGSKGHSGSLATAYSFGKPVVATTAGEFYSMVHEPGCGKIVPPGNPDKLAETIVELLQDDALRSEMVTNCLLEAERLSWDNIAKQHLAVYEAVIEERGSRSS